MKIAALFLWLAFPIAAYVTYHSHGSPHALWSFRFMGNGDPYNPLAHRHYTSCSYIGWGMNSVTTPASSGRCKWVRLFKHADQ